jgi:hypothetical protein
MSRLASAFAFPLGGEGLSEGRPWVVNLIPTPGSQNVSLTRPVRFSFRDSETFVDPGQMLVEVGYAKSFAFATSVDAFDNIPRTKRGALQPGALGIDPDIDLVPEGIRIEKNIYGPQRSVYATAVDAISNRSAMVSAVVMPDPLVEGINVNVGPLNPSIYPGPLVPLPYSNLDLPFASGTVIGLEHGPSNKVVYIFFEDTSPNKKLRLTGFLPPTGTPSLNLETFYNWAAGQQRYTIVWDEALGYVEVYVDFNGETNRVFQLPLTSVPDMPNDYFARFGTNKEVIGVYGQEGVMGSSATWKNVAVTTDVGFPVLGNIRPGNFLTTVLGSELLRTTGERDPRDLDIVTWKDVPASLIPNPDPFSSVAISPGTGIFRMTKATSGTSFALYREEPGFLHSNTEGFMVQARMVAKNARQEQASSGMGIVIYDGISIFQLLLFDDFAVKTVGLLKKGGTDADITQYFIPSTNIDWSEKTFRFSVNPRTGRIRMYILPDLSTPVMDIPFDRAQLPEFSDRGWEGKVPFIAFGHIYASSALGTLEFSEISYSHLVQEWEGNQDVPPTDISVAPQYTATTQGTPTLTMDTANNVYRITTVPGSTAKIHRESPFTAGRGGIIEARLRITSHRSRSRSGVYMLVDDGNFAYSLTFVDTNIGKFVALSKRDNSTGFREIVGRDGDAATLSFAFDWSEFHTYSLERTPYSGLKVFVDGEASPRLTYPEHLVPELPNQQFSGIPAIAFGHFTGEAAISEWSFVRGYFSGGYEISFKKNKPDKALREELFATQALVVAYALDTDI